MVIQPGGHGETLRLIIFARQVVSAQGQQLRKRITADGLNLRRYFFTVISMLGAYSSFTAVAIAAGMPGFSSNVSSAGR